MATQAQITAVQQLYVSYLGRAADSAGLAFWSNAISTGTATVASVATGLTLANEYKTAYAGLTNDALVDKVYTNVLGRPADAAGKAFWVASFANGSVKADTFVASLISSLGTQDQQTINNKTFVAQTYTDTVGTSYNASAATSVLVGVNSTAASVNTAITAITSGSLPGLTPGVNLIAAVSTAATAIDTYAKQIAASNPTFDTVKDGSVTSAEATAAFNAATTLRADAANGGAATTATLQANVTNATNAATASKAIVSALAGGTAAVTAYDSALAAQKVTLGTPAEQTAAASAKAAADVGLAAAVSAAGATVTLTTLGTAGGTTFADTAALYTYLTDPATNAVQRAAVVTELNKVTTYGASFNAAADKGLAVAKANALVTTTKATLEGIDTDAGTVGVQATDYATKAAAAVTAADTLVKAQAADVAVATAKTVVDQYTILNKASADATAAITAFNTNAANVGKVAITGLTGATEGTVAKDVFYFPTKIVGANDFAIGTTTAFGAGDAIVLGSGYTFNSGALTTGNNSALEVFFVKGASGTQVVIETNAVGSATTVTGTDGNVTSSADTAVINLVGVTADHLSFNNGVVSYV
ncbi:hypothetical protein CFII64_28224 [Pseudomonas sp. CFII64]|uniref:DUF4214 domain-containing protein n=1 Tax=Pseudomonas sp. CFII64 TaxID=911242 RepID=UPI000357731F|nr:DUF4214 domain-containing protein [Pseudomonas sp. CFII64]EPJ75782.1 hypothetical protein CFII64_28224 [Pseudomonas sp. CFII64]